MTVTLRTLSTKAKARSGLQLQVLALYRSLLRTTLGKDRLVQGADVTVLGANDVNSFVRLLQDSTSTTYNVSTKFRKEAESMSKREIDLIEYGIRRGEKYIKLLNMGSVRGFKMSGWLYFMFRETSRVGIRLRIRFFNHVMDWSKGYKWKVPLGVFSAVVGSVRVMAFIRWSCNIFWDWSSKEWKIDVGRHLLVSRLHYIGSSSDQCGSCVLGEVSKLGWRIKDANKSFFDRTDEKRIRIILPLYEFILVGTFEIQNAYVVKVRVTSWCVITFTWRLAPFL